MKKGEVMSEPTTFAEVLAEALKSHTGDFTDEPESFDGYDLVADNLIRYIPDEWNPDKMAEARANADREAVGAFIRDELPRLLADVLRQEWNTNWSAEQSANAIAAKVLAASERKS